MQLVCYGEEKELDDINDLFSFINRRNTRRPWSTFNGNRAAARKCLRWRSGKIQHEKKSLRRSKVVTVMLMCFFYNAQDL